MSETVNKYQITFAAGVTRVVTAANLAEAFALAELRYPELLSARFIKLIATRPKREVRK